MNFEGKTALVTGGSRGIGRAIAFRLARGGAHVTVVSRTKATLDATVAEMTRHGLSASAIAGDVTVDSDIAHIVDTVIADHGSIDILVNNAGTDNSESFASLTREQWERILRTDLTSAFLVSQAVAHHMVRRGSGAIINIGSINAFGADGSPVHSAAKAGVHSLTRDIAVELAGQGVRCVTVAPGWVDTEMTAEAMSPEMLLKLRGDFKRIPLGRLLHTEEIANAVAFAASDEASGITGTEIVVDGGALASLYVYGTIL